MISSVIQVSLVYRVRLLEGNLLDVKQVGCAKVFMAFLGVILRACQDLVMSGRLVGMPSCGTQRPASRGALGTQLYCILVVRHHAVFCWLHF